MPYDLIAPNVMIVALVAVVVWGGAYLYFMGAMK